MFSKKDNELKQAFAKRAEAKNDFVKMANNKKSSKSDILVFYKEYRKADDHLIALYEKYQKREGGAYGQAA